jgi:hypothetical protein
VVNNSININKMNNYHSPEIIEHKKKHHNMLKSWLGTDTKVRQDTQPSLLDKQKLKTCRNYRTAYG